MANKQPKALPRSDALDQRFFGFSSTTAAAVLSSGCIAAYSCAQEQSLFSLHGDLSTAIGGIPTATALLRHAVTLAFALSFLGIATTIGGFAIQRAGLHISSPSEFALYSFTLGVGICGSALFLLALFGAYSPNILKILWACGLALLITQLRKLSALTHGVLNELRSLPLTSRALFATLLLVWMILLRRALAPMTFYDALQYHLALPAKYLAEGRALPTPENSYSGIPALPQFFFGWTLSLDMGGIAANAFHCSFVLWTALAISVACGKLGVIGASGFAACAALLAPVALSESSRLSVGLELALFQLCSIIAIINALRLSPEQPQRPRWLLVAGATMGMAMAAKYPAWLLPLTLVPLALRSKDTQQGLSKKDLLLVLGSAALVCAPWILKNCFWYGNPTYPFFNEWFARDAANGARWQLITGDISLITRIFTADGAKRYIATALRLVTQDGYWEHSLGLFWLGLLPLALIRDLDSDQKYLAWYCLLTWIPLTFLTSLSRFYLPYLAPLTILLCTAIWRAAPRDKVLLTLLGASLMFPLALRYLITSGNPAANLAIEGRVSASDYLGHTQVSYPAPPFPAIEHINGLAPVRRVLLHGDSRAFHLRKPFLASSDDQPPLLDQWASKAKDASELREILRAREVSHIIVNYGNMSRLKTPLASTPRNQLVLSELFSRHAVAIFGVNNFGDRWVAAYEIR